MKSPIFDIEIIEPNELDMDLFKKFLDKYPVTVFQELNKKMNKRDFSIAIDMVGDIGLISKDGDQV
ncbi:MAG: hypothetical protein H8D23_11630 [Candidatus Brocadiales bacterium]|nr:hypothetical protein [Candidatus Brocadiales bacterium]